MNQTMTRKGYLMVNFTINGAQKGFLVHRLVATQFKPNLDQSRPQVNHIDGVKTNNNVDNLEWVSPKENVRHAIDILKHDNIGIKNHNARGVVGIDKNNGSVVYRFDSMSDAGRFFAAKNNSTLNSCKTCIWKAINGRCKSYMGCIWRYSRSRDGTGRHVAVRLQCKNA